jgi:hypothetical protein
MTVGELRALLRANVRPLLAMLLVLPLSAALLGASVGPSPAAEQPATFTLDITATASQDVTLAVRSPSRIPFKIIHGGGPVSGTAMLDVSPFINDQGIVQLFTISVGSAPAEGTDHVRDISFENPVLTATLNVPPDLPTGSKYTGRLILTVPAAW